jgi:uncharacterized protein
MSRRLHRCAAIWFVEKGIDGASSLYPLSDFEVRKDENYERGYLQGRFGALPFLGDVRAVRSAAS